MTDDYALPPREALEVLAAIGAVDPARLMRDHAAAGLIRTYAQIQITIDHRGERTTLRGGAVPPALWERMIRDGVDTEVWTGGTVRLAGSDLIGGEDAVNITGIAFHPGDLARLARQQRSTPTASSRQKSVAAGSAGASVPHHADEPAPRPAKQRKAPDLTALHSGALHLTVEQTKAALAISHTTFYKLLNAGRLERAPSEAGTRIMADSVRRYAGLAG